MREIELLSPAANKEIAVQAILHGADAVYMGAQSHGARKNASNSTADIAEVVAFAHGYSAKVYVTVNTLVYEKEIPEVERLIRELYRIGVDALIIQDMGILRMNIPPIALHASTQCDNRDIGKIKFLEKAGFSQIVLARELSLKEIGQICKEITVPVECFVHGALCVSYSGRCRASMATTGRSANRGECSQLCRYKYDLTDANGKVIEKDKYLLSLKDFNASASIDDLIEAGVSSFKIEGRLKDAEYVKNITAYYDNLINKYIEKHPQDFKRSSKGRSIINFQPAPERSFNRGFTEYFLKEGDTNGKASLLTPKSLGERINNINELSNGDGISFFNDKGEYEGVRVNRIEKGKIIGNKPFFIPKNRELRRTYSQEWQNALGKETASRKLWLDLTIDAKSITASDELGNNVAIELRYEEIIAKNELKPERILGKLGNTKYELRKFTNNLRSTVFIPASILSKAKNELLNQLEHSQRSRYKFHYRRKESIEALYPVKELNAEYNTANSFAEAFYKEHGAFVKDYALETDMNGLKQAEKQGIPVMRTRYCIRKELGMCKRERELKKDSFKEPFYLKSGKISFRVEFNCQNCGMIIYDH